MNHKNHIYHKKVSDKCEKNIMAILEPQPVFIQDENPSSISYVKRNPTVIHGKKYQPLLGKDGYQMIPGFVPGSIVYNDTLKAAIELTDPHRPESIKNNLSKENEALRYQHCIVKFLQLSIFLFYVVSIFSCKKSEFLNAVPDKSLLLPDKLSYLEGLVNNDYVMNGSSNSGYGINPSYGEAGSDDYFIYDNDYAYLDLAAQNIYKWSDDIYIDNLHTSYDWDYPYRAIAYANTAIEGVDKLSNLSPSDQKSADYIKGAALFFRSEMFYQLGEVFAPPYDVSTSGTDLSIPLRLKADITEPINRTTVSEVFSQVKTDLCGALKLLPDVQILKTKPSKVAAAALLSRVFLSMHNYDSAFFYSNIALKLYNTLIDFNTLDASNSYPFQRYNSEVILHTCLVQNYNYLYTGMSYVDSSLYNMYDSNDLRKDIYFQNTSLGAYFRGSYDGSNYQWGGIATDELYLTRAECYARNGDMANAMSDLNQLMQTRWKTGTFIPYTAANSNDALSKILRERRKELVNRGARWIDIRRLNKEGANITLARKINGTVFTLTPNSPRYAYLIPPDVLSANPKMPQNAR